MKVKAKKGNSRIEGKYSLQRLKNIENPKKWGKRIILNLESIDNMQTSIESQWETKTGNTRSYTRHLRPQRKKKQKTKVVDTRKYKAVNQKEKKP